MKLSGKRLHADDPPSFQLELRARLALNPGCGEEPIELEEALQRHFLGQMSEEQGAEWASAIASNYFCRAELVRLEDLVEPRNGEWLVGTHFCEIVTCYPPPRELAEILEYLAEQQRLADAGL